MVPMIDDASIWLNWAWTRPYGSIGCAVSLRVVSLDDMGPESEVLKLLQAMIRRTRCAEPGRPPLDPVRTTTANPRSQHPRVLRSEDFPGSSLGLPCVRGTTTPARVEHRHFPRHCFQSRARAHRLLRTSSPPGP